MQSRVYERVSSPRQSVSAKMSRVWRERVGCRGRCSVCTDLGLGDYRFPRDTKEMIECCL